MVEENEKPKSRIVWYQFEIKGATDHEDYAACNCRDSRCHWHYLGNAQKGLILPIPS